MAIRSTLAQPVSELAPRRRGRAVLRPVSPVGVNAEFVASLSAARELRQRPGRWWRDIGRRARLLTPKLGRRAKGVVLILAVLSAVVLANLSVASGPDHHVASGGVAQAVDLNDCGFLQFACDAIQGALNIAGKILDGIANLVSQAISPNNFCDRTDMEPDRPDSGFSGFILSAAQTQSQYFQGYNTNAGTTWSKYGAAGTDWNTYFLDCLSASNIVNSAAGLVFGFSKIISIIAIVLFQQTFNSGLLNIFLGGSPPPVQQIIDDLKAQVYVELSSVAIVIGAVVLAWRAILKGFGLADFLSKFVLMVAVAGFSTLFFSHAIPWVKWANEQTNEISNSVMTALRGSDCTNSQGQKLSGLSQVDCTAESIYNTLVYVPWATGEVGSLGIANDSAATKAQNDLAARILAQQAYTWADVSFGNGAPKNDNQQKQVDQQIADGKKVKVGDRDLMILGADKAKLPDDVASKIDPKYKGDPGWGLKVYPTDGSQPKDFDPTAIDSYSQVHATKISDSVWQMYSGGDAGERFAIAVMAVVAALTFGVMLIGIAVTYLVLQIATVLFALVAPVVALIALVPVYGFRVALKYGEMFIGTFIKRVAMVTFVAVILTLYQLILSTQGIPWWLQMVLVLAIALGAMSYRKKLTSISTLGFGAGLGAAGAGLGQSSARMAAMRGTWQDTQGMPLASRLGAATRSGASTGAGGSGIRNSTIVNQSQSVATIRQQQAAAAAARRSSLQGYSPAGRGPASRTGRASVPRNAPMAGPGGAARGVTTTYRPGGAQGPAGGPRGAAGPQVAGNRPRPPSGPTRQGSPAAGPPPSGNPPRQPRSGPPPGMG